MKIVRRASALFGLSLGLAAMPALAGDINVGPTRAYKTLAAGVAAARTGDRVLLDAGVYINDTAVTSVPLTIEGVGPGVTLRAISPIANQKGILVARAALTVRNLTFDGAQVTDNNGAGIRVEAGDLTVDNAIFINNQDGILVNPIPGAVITVTNSTFTGNGIGDGYTHAIYANEVAQLAVADSTFNGTKAGHDIKSRALATTISRTFLDDGVTGTTSYAVDLPNGGAAVLDKVTVTQGVNSQNPTMVAYGAEGNLKAANSLTVSNSTFNDQMHTSSVVAVRNFTGTPAVLANDIFNNVAQALVGAGAVQALTAAVNLRAAAIFSSRQTAGQSYFRFYNGDSTAGTVTVSLYDPASGALLSEWVSPSIPPGAAPQFPVTTIEAAARQPYNIPLLYSLTVQSNFNGSFQHILFRPLDGTVSNLSVCDGALTTPPGRLTNVHSSLIASGFPSSIVIYNTGGAAAPAVLGLYDARNGSRLGGYTTASIPPLGQAIVPASVIEAALRLTPTGSLYHYNIKVENAFTGMLQHLVDNQHAGLMTDMTAVCALTH